MDAVVDLVAGRFGRVEPRRRVSAYLRGLLAGLERKNGWTLAEHAGARSPDGMQRLLRTAGWDVDGVRDDLRGYVLERLGDSGGVWVVDETGCAPRGADDSCGRRSPPPVIAVAGEAGGRPIPGLGVRPGAASTT